MVKPGLLHFHEASELLQELETALARFLVAQDFNLVLLHLALDVAVLAEQPYLGGVEARGRHFNQGIGLAFVRKSGRAKVDRAENGEVLGGDVLVADVLHEGDERELASPDGALGFDGLVFDLELGSGLLGNLARNGWPVGAVGDKRELVRVVAPIEDHILFHLRAEGRVDEHAALVVALLK